MKDVVITADSTCDLPKNIIEKHNIIITPLSILLGNKSYKDGVEIFPNDIYSHVEKTGELPKTAAVTPAEYFELFQRLTSDGKAVVHISLSSAISSSCQNACIAAADFDDVYIVNSKSLCTAMGLLVLKACDFREKGFDAKKIAARLTGIAPKISTTFVLDSLEYMHKGGRCSGVTKFSANVLGIRPSIGINPKNGELEIIKKYRGKAESVYRQYADDCMRNSGKIDTARIVVANSGGIDNETLGYTLGLISGKEKFSEIITADAGCTISSHCGPKTLAIFYIKK